MHKYVSLEDAWVAAHNHDGFEYLIDTCSFNTALQWFKTVTQYPKIIWHSREEDCTYFAIGMTTDLVQQIVFEIRGFDASEPQWTGFPGSLSIRPQHLLKWTSTHSILQSSIVSTKTSLPFGVTPQDSPHLPTKDHWVENIEHSHTLFNETPLQKIVLARQSHFILNDPWEKFVELYTGQTHCYHFWIQPTKDRCFFGASPEKLFSINERFLETEALAGTAPVTGDHVVDSCSSNELVTSTKDQNEHEIVVQYLENQLNDLSTSRERYPQELVKLSHVQHLRTRLTYQLSSDVELSTILTRLHPTPAVCGLPKHLARREISKLEPFHRGWYAGTMGIVNQNFAEFTVLIRSALWINGMGYTWSGAGIVEASNPEAEWTEINNKAKQFLG